MEFSDLSTGRSDIRQVELKAPVREITHVEAWRWRCRPAGQDERVFTLIYFDREAALLRVWEELRGAVVIEGGEVIVRDEERARLWGQLLWSKLHPDIGTRKEKEGYSASLAKRTTYFASFFGWLSDLSRQKNLWSFLEETGRSEKLPTFAEWKKRVHFADRDLPTRHAIRRGRAFLAATGVDLAVAECRHRLNPRWVAKAEPGQLPAKFYSWVRGDSTALVKEHRLSLGGQHAATLISYAAAIQIGDRLAQEILANLPDGLLDDTGRKLFRAMWCVSRVGVDDHGRHDLPLMAAPVLYGALKYVLEIDDDDHPRDKEDIVCGLLDFAATGKRNRAVDIALGFGLYHRQWLDAERAGERAKTRARIGTGRRYAQEKKHLRRNALPGKPTKVPDMDQADDPATVPATGNRRHSEPSKRYWQDGERIGRPTTKRSPSRKKR